MPATPTGRAGEGNHWVKLSTDDNVLGDLESMATSAGCAVRDRTMGVGRMYGAFAVDCRRDVVVISQERDVLLFRCRALRGEDCEALMEEIAPRPARGCF